MIRRPPRSTRKESSAASDVYKRQVYDGFLARMIQIPINDDLTLGRNAMEIGAAPPSAAEVLERPFRALLHAITVSPAPAAQVETDDVTHLARLALALRGRLPTSMPEVRAASRAATRHLACLVMQRSLHRPELSPAMVATSLGISCLLYTSPSPRD